MQEESDILYIEQMESWFREQEAHQKQLISTIENSTTILEENKVQLAIHARRVEIAKEEFLDWKKSREVE